MDTETPVPPKPLNSKTFLSIKRILLVVLVLVISVGFPFLVQTLILSRINFNPGAKADKKHFEILSEPPDTAIVGEEFFYLVQIGQYDSSNVFLQVVTKPEWLKWDQQKLKLSGTPTDSNLGQNYVVIKATDTEITKEQAFTIYVEAANGDVQGVEDDRDNSNDGGVISESENKANDACQKYYDELGPLGVLSKHPECTGVYASNPDVLGASDQNRVDGSVLPGLNVSRVGVSNRFFGMEINDDLKTGLTASLAVIFGGAALVLGWITITSFRRTYTKPTLDLGDTKAENSSAGPKFNIGTKRKSDQKSFIQDDSTGKNIIIWD